jgi:hypothetical protein
MKRNAFILVVLTAIILSACCNGRKPAPADNTTNVSDAASKMVYLQAFNGKYVSSDNSKSDSLIADRDTTGDWELFEMLELGDNNVCFRNYAGKYVCADESMGNVLIANRDNAGAWETYTMTDLGSGNYSFQNYKGKYFSANQTIGGRLYADKDSCGEWEKFKVVVKK